MDPTKIELTNLAGTVTVKLDNSSQEVSIQAASKISLTSAQLEVNAPKIDITGAEINITCSGPFSVTGLPIKLN